VALIHVLIPILTLTRTEGAIWFQATVGDGVMLIGMRVIIRFGTERGV
jgi:hypothetical protein